MESRVVEIALRIGLFEALRQPSTLPAVAASLSIGGRATEAIVAVLAARGLVLLENGNARLSGIAREYFLEESPFFKGALFRLISEEEMELLREVHLQDGLPRPATARWLLGTVLDAEGQAANMHAHTFAAASVFAALPVFGQVKSLLDVAGGGGTLSIALALANPGLRSTVMDLPGMAPVASAMFERFAVAERVRFLGADMFKQSWPTGSDAVLFSNIFHDWELPRCHELTRKAFEALPSGGRIFVNEMLLDEDRGGPLGPALFSAMMLFKMEGRQFTFSGLESLLHAAGFTAVERVSTFGYYTLLSATRP
jgi:acetylserotonin N-methyltransferase